MEIKDIKAIIDLMKKNSITEFELEEKDSKLRLKRGLSGSPAVIQSDEAISMLPLAMPVATPIAAASAQAALPVAASTGEIDIKSPMIGTFYRSPSPGQGRKTRPNPDSHLDLNLLLHFFRFADPASGCSKTPKETASFGSGLP